MTMGREETLKTEKRFFKSRNEKQCDFCEFKTETLDLLKAHLLELHWNLIFCCNICNMYWPSEQLIRHMTEHAEKLKQKTEPIKKSSKLKCEKSFKCSQCDYKCTTKRLLLNHQRSIHERDKRSFKCETCGKRFKTDSTLYTHKKLHTKEKPFACKMCDKRFRLKHHLTGHMLQHRKFRQGERLPFECKCCHKQFAAADNLCKHMKIHDQTLGDFTCHICGTKMRQKRYLRQHMQNVHLQRSQNALG